MAPADRTILIVDDDAEHVRAFEDALRADVDGDGAGDIDWVRTLADGLERLAFGGAWAVFVHLDLPDSHGVQTVDSVLAAAAAAGIPVVVLAGVADEPLCKLAMRHGARDYLLDGHIDAYGCARAIRNIVEREVARRELFIEKERAQVTLNSIGDAVLSVDRSGHVTYLNAVAEHMTGWSNQEAAGRLLTDVFQIIDSATRKPPPNPLDLAIQLDRAVGLSANCILIRRDGTECFIEDSSAPIHDRDGLMTGAVIVFHDVNMARARMVEMNHLAQHDVLTDLPNRWLLKERLTQAIKLARRNLTHVAVLFLDLDGFKAINDSLGHVVGDSLLLSVTTRLLACVRDSDTVSRQGGDEFVILLADVKHAKDAAISAANIVAELKRVHCLGEHRATISASIGISCYPGDGNDAETLIRNADTAMYYVKQSGRNRHAFFDKDMVLRSVERRLLVDELRSALERRALSLQYQPTVSLATGVITGVEALVRWSHPERGLIPTERWLALADESGLSLAIGEWALHEACRQTREWMDAGLAAVPVAVNVSSMEFRGEEFFNGVHAALGSSGIHPWYLELALTESALMRHAEATAYALDELKSLGVRLIIDRFGTGYSSLSYLTRFPIDALKLDGSFVRDFWASSGDEIVLGAVIGMGKSLNHRVIAGGVNTRRQLALLQVHGCDEGQGGYFGRPVNADQFGKMLKEGHCVAV